jgi:NADH:ubiquinone oxidoreductase subunit 6 (subunit J)
MTLTFLLLAVLILGSALAAAFRPNLIHSALLLVVSWLGVAGFYLWAGAEFVAFAQVLVYVGAISMVVLFAVLLTRQSRAELRVTASGARRTVWAVVAGLAVSGVIGAAVVGTNWGSALSAAPEVTVRGIGLELMGAHAAALLVLGVLLTAALLGAVVLAAPDRPEKEERP